MQCAGWAERSMPMLMESVVPDSEKSVVTRDFVPVFLSCSTTLTSTARREKMGERSKGPLIHPFSISALRFLETVSWCSNAPFRLEAMRSFEVREPEEGLLARGVYDRCRHC